jgi:hypothetical protein
MKERKDLSQEELDALFEYAEEALKNVGATDVSTKTSGKPGKFKAECDKGCKECQPNILCPNDKKKESSGETFFFDLNPPPAPDPKDFISRR